ncbi:MAG: methyltransferase [Bacteroidales bacterium]|nr:methyltransferase [Bacteroidales bacterium]
MSNPFQFKQFKVCDSSSAMKVGTDAVLLGAFIKIGDVKSILDIGTGCGVIALMLAQRSNVNIDAIDIDNSSIEEANRNFKNSPWPGRLIAIHTSLQDFARESNRTYDLIVSNPPFFENSLEPPDLKKKFSKHSKTLLHGELLAGVNKLLKPKGRFSVILPFSERTKFINLALLESLFCNRELLVYPKQGKKTNRIFLEFSKMRSEVFSKFELTIRNSNDSYTQEYISLTKDFYIKF